MKKIVFLILLFILLAAMVMGAAAPPRARVGACAISPAALAIEK
jgi:hypothetical protein